MPTSTHSILNFVSVLRDDFRDYAELCFERFGDRVKHWITLNEPWTYAVWGYDYGENAPGRCSLWKNRACKAGNSAVEPYIVAHHQLLSHAAAVDGQQKGLLGATLVTWWTEPYSSKTADIDAAKRVLDFIYGWFLDPLTYGDYPRTMRDYVKDRLPKFTKTQSEMLRGSLDFLGLNYYSSRYVKHVETQDPWRISYTSDLHADLLYENWEGQSIGPGGGVEWLRIAPFGIRYLLNYTKDNYKNPPIFITENGVASDDSEQYCDIINDTIRIEFYESHIGNVSKAIKEYNVSVEGFLAWSSVDTFEWSSGYTVRFGLAYIDFYRKNLTRIPKSSLEWLKGKLLGGDSASENCPPSFT
ncbi:hypothetical protein Tsubulata_047346 [Turnera subulata]|uniref:Beta-glucosidase n=1 Tax=Turnera subulata TaxID=218843 RepID=A0A9Q0G3T4_9ROSI|nr:hypothetical protein Tsubulata_047346 [Turnera subulata]